MTNEDKKATRARKKAEFLAGKEKLIDSWRTQSEQYFGYLVRDFGFHLVSVTYEWYVTRTIYRSASVAVYVDRSVEFERVEISILRLIDGAIPPTPLPEPMRAFIFETIFDNILIVRAPMEAAASQAFKELSDEQIAQALAFWARALRTHGADILQGDFAIFADVQEMIEQRRHQS
ncbi:MAG: hypothetical protein H0X24_10680 [Ktedonobacterales bacterium]|nr:hypothetical protein [Ktedonobacterales bacterium]